MVFDMSKDKVLKELTLEAEKGNQRIEVKLVSYNNGPEKIQLSRLEVSDGAEPKYLKLGRMTLTEAERVRDALAELTTGE